MAKHTKPLNPAILWLFTLLILIFFSCSQDTDILLEAILEEPMEEVAEEEEEEMEEEEEEEMEEEVIAEEEEEEEEETVYNDPIDDIPPPYTGGAGNKDISTETALRVFYVSVNGSASNDGLSQGSPIDIETAFDVDRIKPGDLYWIKAGDYGNINIELNQPGKTAGTETNPIGWIGYKDTPGDIKAVEGPTVSWDDYIANGHDLDPSEMPTLTGSDSQAPNFLINEHAIELNHWKEHIVIRNFQIRQYETGILMQKGENNIFDNIIIANNGYFADIEGQGGSNQDLLGSGIVVRRETGYNKVTNSYTMNMAIKGFSFDQDSSYNLIEWCRSDTDNDSEHNPQDYYFHIVGKYNVLRNISARKLTESNHSGHGLCFNWDANQEWGGQYNYAENVEIVNTGIHFDGAHTHHNTVKNATLSNDRTHYIYGVHVTFMDGANNNLLEDSTLRDGSLSFADSGAHVDNGNAGNNNTVRRVTFSNNEKAIKFSNWSTEYPAFNNTFVDCIFKDLENLFEVERENYGNRLIDCEIQNVPSLWYEDDKTRDYALSSTTIFENCNFWESEIPSATEYKATGTTQKPPGGN